MGGAQLSHGTILTIRIDPGDAIFGTRSQPVGYPAASAGD
jgi:hypothetical protein